MAASARLPARFFHGSSLETLERFDIKRSDDQNPFGPGVYLTTDLAVASRCTKGAGAVFMVQVQGDPHMVLDLDLALQKQSGPCAAAVSVLLKFAGHAEQLDYGINAREAIDLVVPKLGKRYRNAFLASSGVWMLQGHLSATDRRAFDDPGMQYLVLDTRAISDFYLHAAASGRATEIG
jgi:hypothetical protein